jgi:hypothetical protein
MARLQTHLFVPLYRDKAFGGGLHTTDKLEKLTTDLFVMFKGHTLGPGIFKGVYEDPDTGEPVEDESLQFIVALEEDRIPELREYIRKVVAPSFGQKYIYFYNGRDVEFIEGAKIQE